MLAGIRGSASDASEFMFGVLEVGNNSDCPPASGAEFATGSKPNGGNALAVPFTRARPRRGSLGGSKRKDPQTGSQYSSACMIVNVCKRFDREAHVYNLDFFLNADTSALVARRVVPSRSARRMRCTSAT